MARIPSIVPPDGLRVAIVTEHAHARRALEVLAVLLGSTVFVLVVTWPIASGIGDVVVGEFGGDSTGGVWWLWALQHEGGFHLTGSTLHTLTGAPLGWAEGNGLNIQWALPYYPAYLAAKLVGEVAAYNLAIVSGVALSGAAMYALTRYLGCHPAVAAWAGLVYVLFPWHLQRVVHASLVHLEALPLLLLALIAATRSRRSDGAGRRWPYLLAAAAANLACWMTSGYYGVMALIATVVFAGVVVLVNGEQLPRARLRLLAGLTGGAVGAAAIVYAIGSLGSAGDAIVEFDRRVADLDDYGLRLYELVVPTGDGILGRWTEPFLSSRLHDSNSTEAANYVGLLTLVLAAAWLVVAWRRRDVLPGSLRAATLGLTAVLVAAVLLALPSPFLGLDLTPSRLLFDHLTTAIRVPARWIALVMTVLVPLAALGLQAAWNLVVGGSRGRTHALRYGLVLVAAAVSFAELYQGSIEPTFRATPVPDRYRAVASTPDGILAEYPLRRSDLYLFWQRRHGRPLVNVRQPGTRADDTARVLVDPGSPGTAEKLAALGVTAIVTRPDALGFAEDGFPDVPDASWGPGYALVERSPDGSSVWRVTASPAPAIATLPSTEFGRPASPVDGVVFYDLLSEGGSIELNTDADRVVRLRFDVAPTEEGATELRLHGANGELVTPLVGKAQVSAVVRIPQGRSRLRVETDTPGVAVSAPWVVPASPSNGALVAEPLP